MRDENPLVIEPSLRKVIGGTYSDIKVLPSGDISVKCASQKYAKKLLLWKYLGNSEKLTEIRTELYQSKGTEARGVISDAPLDLTDGDILNALSTNTSSVLSACVIVPIKVCSLADQSLFAFLLVFYPQLLK